MACEVEIPQHLRAEPPNVAAAKSASALPGGRSSGPLHGLLITADRALARTFRRELGRCVESTLPFDVRANFEQALTETADAYHWVGVDLDGAIAPSEAVRLARCSWPTARVVVLSGWWSERDVFARDLADLVIHKPLRMPEMLAFLRALSGAQQPDEERPHSENKAEDVAQAETVTAATG